MRKEFFQFICLIHDALVVEILLDGALHVAVVRCTVHTYRAVHDDGPVQVKRLQNEIFILISCDIEFD